jgi:glycosyltransferase involved in cell wall biosynthesis
VGQIILIDMASQDRTVEIARPLVDRILSHPHIANFDCARNIAVPESKFEWLWFVDADERVPQQTGEIVNRLLRERGDEFEAINIPFKTYFCGKWIEHSGWWPGYTMPRVLKKGYFRFSERLHGGVELNGREIRLAPDPKLGVDHFSYLSLEHYIEKLNRYTSTEAAQLHQAGQSTDWRNAIAHMTCDLWLYYEANQGVLDGRHGWILAWLSGQYRWLSHAKLLDLELPEASSSSPTHPQDLNAVLTVMRQELERLRRTAPRLPLGVVWRSPIWDPSGYADEGRCITKALSHLPRHVALEEICWSDKTCQIMPDDAGLFRAMQRSTRADSNVAITNCIPTLVQPDSAAFFNVIRTTFETDRIPDGWFECLERFDEVWVISEHNRQAFIRGGVAPEKTRLIPSFLDTGLYRPDGPKLALPPQLKDRFVFLSVFDWQLRKGWDLLLKAYCQCFPPEGGTGLLLKVTRSHGHGLDFIQRQIGELLDSIDVDFQDRNDIVVIDDQLSAAKMVELYRTADAFVLPSRGEGWGRPYMEAMACGVPVIGTGASGNVDFMNAENSFLIPAELVDIPKAASIEINVYDGHKWFEPDFDDLKRIMKVVHLDKELACRVASKGLETIRNGHNLLAGRGHLEQAIDAIEARFQVWHFSDPKSGQIKIEWEGEFFAGHSFSNINEALAKQFIQDQRFAVSIKRQIHNPTGDRDSQELGMFKSHFDRKLPDGPDVVIRHAFPPNWEKPAKGKWIHIQPWEFGHLPEAWIEPLRDQVDEIWVPSNYVRRVYERSSIPTEKIQVIPWGIDTDVFTPAATPRILPTNKSFRFLYVGGTIHRKGFDRVLEAYLQEFSPNEDVCLVVKDLGTNTFYRYGNLRGETISARDNQSWPEIVYFDGSWTPGQLASLYTACNCLVMPYRGEGFGLPILEAMACGIPPIVPRGGASDDFVSEESGYLLESREVETQHEWPLVGPALELEVSLSELRSLMRTAFENKTHATEKGNRAARNVSQQFTWDKTRELMVHRTAALLTTALRSQFARNEKPKRPSPAIIRAYIETNNCEAMLAECLASLAAYVDEMVVVDSGSSDRTLEIAAEYGAKVVSAAAKFDHNDPISASNTWAFWLKADQILEPKWASQIKPLILAQPAISTEVTMSLGESKSSHPLEIVLNRKK